MPGAWTPVSAPFPAGLGLLIAVVGCCRLDGIYPPAMKTKMIFHGFTITAGELRTDDQSQTSLEPRTFTSFTRIFHFEFEAYRS